MRVELWALLVVVFLVPFTAYAWEEGDKQAFEEKWTLVGQQIGRAAEAKPADFRQVCLWQSIG